MKIIICDDSIKEAEKTKEVLVSNKLADESDITIFLPDDLRGEIERRTLSCDIAVMDIEFDAVPYNGINLSAAINELLPFSQIIYLTNIMSKIRAGYGYKDVNTAAEIAKSDIPVLFIHGENDEFVPLWMTMKNYSHCKAYKELYIVRESEHAESHYIDKKGYERRILTFIEKISK